MTTGCEEGGRPLGEPVGLASTPKTGATRNSTTGAWLCLHRWASWQRIPSLARMASNSLALALFASVAPAMCAGPMPQLPRSLSHCPSSSQQAYGSDGSSGFLDPVGFSKKDDKAGSRNHRAAEIKHGRVAMMAALGGVVQHYIKFPGFDDVPVVLSAMTSAPGTTASWPSRPPGRHGACHLATGCEEGCRQLW